MTVREIDAPPHQPRIDWSAVATTGALSTVIGVLALVTAPGATTSDGTTYDTTFVTEWVWWLAYALVPVAAVLLWRATGSYLTYVATGAALVVPHVVVAAVVLARYQRSGWGYGCPGTDGRRGATAREDSRSAVRGASRRPDSRAVVAST